MKILLLTDSNSPHTEKWATALSRNGFEIGIFSFSPPQESWNEKPGIGVFTPHQFDEKIYSAGLFEKRKYLFTLRELKKVIISFRPDVLHAHYASSYGLIGAMSGFHPFVISVWGSDVNFFSKVPVLGGLILRFNFSRADRILSTSHAMLPSIRKYTGKEITVTPFGIDTVTFAPAPDKTNGKGEIVIGTVKLLERVYAIDNLMRAFAGLKARLPSLTLKLLIVGGGSLEAELKMLAGQLGILGDTTFTGKVPSGEVPSYLRKLDVYAALSVSESFGVAILEASSCGIPVVVSDAGGLPEVVAGGETGFIVPVGDIVKTTDALEKLALDEQLRSDMGKKGRAFVMERFDLKDSVARMISVYEDLKIK
ncbi:MAG: glycosyltransferase [Bacteroidetes bacterium]|nr:glycosyltransferase [Bacteroidota bacterium]